jgi:hypothetical protein
MSNPKSALVIVMAAGAIGFSAGLSVLGDDSMPIVAMVSLLLVARIPLINVVSALVFHSPRARLLPGRTYVMAMGFGAAVPVLAQLGGTGTVGFIANVTIPLTALIINCYMGFDARAAGALTLRDTWFRRLAGPPSEAIGAVTGQKPADAAEQIFGIASITEAVAIICIPFLLLGAAAAASGFRKDEPAEKNDRPAPVETTTTTTAPTTTTLAPPPVAPEDTPDTVSPFLTEDCLAALRSGLEAQGVSEIAAAKAATVAMAASLTNTGCLPAVRASNGNLSLFQLNGGTGGDFALLLDAGRRVTLVYPHALDAIASQVVQGTLTGLRGQYANTVAGFDDANRRSFLYIVELSDDRCEILHRNASDGEFVQLPASASALLLNFVRDGYVQVYADIRADGTVNYDIDVLRSGSAVVERSLTIEYSPRTGTAVGNGNEVHDGSATCPDDAPLLNAYPDGPQFMASLS